MNQLNEMELRRVLAESGRYRVRDMMRFLENCYSNQYDPYAAEVVAKDLVSEIPK